jgi:hypothetical protein
MAFEDISARFWDTRRDYLVQKPLSDEALRATEEEFRGAAARAGPATSSVSSD